MHLILRSVPTQAQAQVAALLARAFSLKEATCTAIAGSAPIIVLSELSANEATAICFALAPLERTGAVFEVSATLPTELSKIDWPRRPQIFKKDFAELVSDLELTVEIGNRPVSLLELIAPRLPALGGHVRPTSNTSRVNNSLQQFRGIQLPEITPFSNPVLPGGGNAVGNGDETMSRLNELFPEDTGFSSSNQDISSLLDQILPDDAPAAVAAAAVQQKTPLGHAISAHNLTPVTAGWSLFLPKFADETRRQKAVPLIAEHGKFNLDDAENLSRKLIIPVIKGGTRDEAEAARQAFAKIGVVAKVKAPGT